MKQRLFHPLILSLVLLPAAGYCKSHTLGEEGAPPAMEASQALARFAQTHKLVRVLRFQKPSSLDIKRFDDKLWTGLAVNDGQVFFTLEKKEKTWTLKDLTIPLNSNEVLAPSGLAGHSGRREVTEDAAWRYGSADFAEGIEARGLVPHKLTWLKLTSGSKQGFELIYKAKNNAGSKLRLMYRTHDFSLVLYSRDPDSSPLKGLSVPGSMPRHIEPVEVASPEKPEPVKLPSFAQVSSAGFCLAALGAIVFLLVSSVSQSLKVQKLIQK